MREEECEELVYGVKSQPDVLLFASSIPLA
jgi:hypothetical protein